MHVGDRLVVLAQNAIVLALGFRATTLGVEHRFQLTATTQEQRLCGFEFVVGRLPVIEASLGKLMEGVEVLQRLRQLIHRDQFHVFQTAAFPSDL